MAKTVRKASARTSRRRHSRPRPGSEIEPPREFKQLELKADGTLPNIADDLNDGWRIYHEWPVYGAIQAAHQIIVLYREKEIAK